MGFHDGVSKEVELLQNLSCDWSLVDFGSDKARPLEAGRWVRSVWARSSFVGSQHVWRREGNLDLLSLFESS